MTLKSVTNSPIERAILKRKRERKEILSIVLHIVSSFSARKPLLYSHHYDAVVIDTISADLHAASTGALGAASTAVIDAIYTDVHADSMSVYDAVATDVYAISTGALGATSSVVYDAASDVHAASTGA